MDSIFSRNLSLTNPYISRYYNKTMSIFHRFSIVILLLTLLTTACTPQFSSKEQPFAVNGIIDLKDWDFEKDGTVKLEGEWKYVWMQSDPAFAEPDYNDSDWDTFTVPSFWNKRMNSKYGYAWFRLKAINVRSPQLMAIYLVHSCMAYKLYYNGRLILKNGK